MTAPLPRRSRPGAGRAIASLAAITAAGVLLASSTASADPAAAEALFREGRRLLDEGKTEEACLKLAESHAQDPSSGTLLNLGLCHEMQHKIATAWSDYVSAARLARDQGKPSREAAAEKKATELEPRLPHLTVTVTAPVDGLEIMRGAERLGRGLFGSAVPIDPGTYLIAASAPGYRAWKTTIDLAEGESKTVEVPELKPQPPPPQAVEGPPPPPANTGVPPAALRETAPASPPVGGGRALGWIIGGTGVATIAVGAGFGVASLASYHDANNLCPSPHKDCSADAISERNSAESRAWICNVAIGVGVVGAGIGGWILLGGRKRASATGISVRAAPEASGMRVSLERSF